MIENLKKILKKIAVVASNSLPSETIGRSKRKWNKLAKENARYYVVSKKGREIKEDDFRKIGKENYQELIDEDKVLNETLGVFSDRVMLDIGCGIGRLEEFFAPNFEKVYGIDISEEMIRQAKERLARFKNVYFKATDGKTYPFEDSTFDFVFSYIVFQHMPSRDVVEQNFKEIFRVLKQRGIAKIQIRGGHTPFKWQWFYGPAWNKEEAISMVENIGFKVLKTEGEGKKRFWLWLEK